jgi:hypothetical protein
MTTERLDMGTTIALDPETSWQERRQVSSMLRDTVSNWFL